MRVSRTGEEIHAAVLRKNLVGLRNHLGDRRHNQNIVKPLAFLISLSIFTGSSPDVSTNLKSTPFFSASPCGNISCALRSLSALISVTTSSSGFFARC